VKYAEAPSWRPRVTVTVSAHLLDWRQARYRVAACNPSGCTNSNELGVSALMQDSVGEFTAGDAAAYDSDLGWTVALSEDGKTLAAGAPGNGVGAVHVWKKSGTQWFRDAVLRPNYVQAAAGYDLAVSISGDGKLVALGTRSEDRPGADPESEGENGAVYLFRRGASSWSLEQKLVIENADYGEALGRRVQLDRSGQLLAVWRGQGEPPGINASGNVELYTHSATGWTRLTTLQVDVNLTDCPGFGLSGDGRTLVRACGRGYTDPTAGYVDVFRAPAWTREARIDNPTLSANEARNVGISYDGSRFAVRSTGRTTQHARSHVVIYHRGSAGWENEATVDPGAWAPANDPSLAESRFGEVVSMSSDGRFLAVGDWRDTAVGNGALYPPISGGASDDGAVYVFERKPTGWKLRQFIRPNTDAAHMFGWSISLGENGNTLAVGAPQNGSVWLY
jgi:hypothetical protein